MEVCSGNVKLGVRNVGMGMFQGVEEPEEPAEQGLKGKAFADCQHGAWVHSKAEEEQIDLGIGNSRGLRAGWEP